MDGICDRIWENPLYGIRVIRAMRVFSLVAQVEIYQSPDFLSYTSRITLLLLPPSTEASRAIRRRNKPSS